MKTTNYVRVGLLAAIVVLLASCSGGHQSMLPSKLGGSSTMASVSFTMHWPSPRNANLRETSVRRPQFISPKTQSVVVEVNNDEKLTTIANKPSQGTVSTVAINAPVGNDEITITTWDQQGGAGNELGQITVSQSIIAGKMNTVNATVDGVVEKLSMSGAPNAFLESSQDLNGVPTFDLIGTVPQTFTVVPEDVDGDVIVPPGDAPALTMTSTDQSIAVSPVSGKSNEYTVTPVFQTAHGTTVSLKVNGTDGLGNIIVQQFAVHQAAAIYVGYANANGASPIVVYDESGKAIATTGSFTGIADVSAIAYDSKRDRLLVADHALGKLASFDLQGNADAHFASSALTGVNGVVYDPDLDRIYATQGTQQSVAAFNGDGSPVSLPGGAFSGMTNPSSITYNPNVYQYSPGPQLYVADDDSSVAVQVPSFNPDGSPGTGSFQYQGSDAFYAAAVAYDIYVNRVFVAGYSNGVPTLRSFDADYGGSPDITATDGLNQPAGIAFNPINHEIYVTNSGDSSVAVFKDDSASSTFPRDTTSHFSPPNGQTSPEGIAIVF